MTDNHSTIRRRMGLFLTAALMLLGGCEYLDSTPLKTDKELRREQSGTVFGEGGLFGGATASAATDGTGLGVNAYLWRATLDTVSIWPVSSVDAHGGVILTDWYSPPQSPGERLKLNVYILDRALRADGVRVAVFRQVRAANGDWQEAAVQPETASRLEDAILMRARQMRNQSASGQ